ncbi:MAG: enoyl-CoA hydratase [Acidobacteria bacterium]|nr:enoyl-CoA hydratase [Acidobacteriota bacterium]
MVITSQIFGPVAVVQLNRPEARNALTRDMMNDLAAQLVNFDADDDIRCVILTGTDPAFCAGLDLKDLERTYNGATSTTASKVEIRGLMPILSTPVVGAINGPAVTGGLELALACDFLIASERSTFADTHGRVGVMPGGGMSIRLPQLIGLNRARQMSLTGNFISATTAYEWGLVNEVVPHDSLLDRALEVARAIAENDPAALRELLAMYEAFGHRGDSDAFREEARWSRTWMKERFDAQRFESTRDGIIQRGSQQQ